MSIKIKGKMNMYKKWECFYCDNSESSENEYPEYVDVISIDIENKKYVLDIHCDERTINGDCEDDIEIIPSYVSREVFDMILVGMKEKDYIKIKEKN